MRWPALMQALALRPGGPPAFRLTGIGPPASDNSDHLQQEVKVMMMEGGRSGCCYGKRGELTEISGEDT
ncbi:hypothetical protein RYX36_020796 [Vicia faba]